ncbi:MAG: leucyl/phenylalanyl-tRNA--protein transferase [Maricaulis sp.]|uniref:leucyl/phenylalanyl-tRNA--protein transferase n=1 Tax=Maricaulis sp. TaxID=1486257 RepID=UPI00262F30CB|nr:leucyl/phenylalanyl-tRNA--protein transferase [Maricaulis sp.]MDM7983529.1 leucyl/phenylalanyl-tRNA--protein transferase [Maricaulis sp.]
MRVFGTAELLDCYALGVFPMADSRDDPRIYLLDPDERGVLPLDGLHISKRLKRKVKQQPYRITYDTAFQRVVEACATPAPGREETWINDGIFGLYSELRRDGYAHSVEAWQGDELVGGLYGVSLGRAFFGESMFSRATDASKIALVYLVARLKAGGYTLLDTQFTTEHLETLGVITITRTQYHERLAEALEGVGDFYSMPADTSASDILQSSTQTS